MTSVFLTGASSGIGWALANLYAKEGATLGLVARRVEPILQLAKQYPGRIHCFKADVCLSAEMEQAAARFMAQCGVPDAVIANAGISHGALAGHPEEMATLTRTLNTNVFGAVATLHPFVEAMKQRGSGTLVGVASIAGLRGIPGSAAYSASKAALLRYLEGMAAELYGTGVGVLTVLPGYIRTPMTAKNPYPMPFLTDADVAAKCIYRAIAAGRARISFPFAMTLVSHLWTLLPNQIYNALVSHVMRRYGSKPMFPSE